MERCNIRVYPNPTTDSFVVQFSTEAYGRTPLLRTIRIFDRAGILILEKQTTEGETMIELKDKPAGIYHIEVNGDWRQVVKS